MQVIPAINCMDGECVREKMASAAAFLPDGGWVHIDVADAKFTYNKTWNDPKELAEILTEYPSLQAEIHLMVEEPEEHVRDWLGAGAKRIIFHVEAVRDQKMVQVILDTCKAAGAEAVVAISPETPTGDLDPYIGMMSRFLILAVTPGLAGQKIQRLAIEKIRGIKSRVPHAHIEFDGGVDKEIAEDVKAAGADTIVAASYIFGSPDPSLAYSMLAGIR